jgi:hypothetical protein
VIREMETSFTYHTLEEVVARLEKNFDEENIDEKEIKKERLEILYDYYCWNLKLISTEKFYASIKKFEKAIYSTGLIGGDKRVTRMIKISLGVENIDKYLRNWIRNLIFSMTRERDMFTSL